jgi:hypothetical protein
MNLLNKFVKDSEVESEFSIIINSKSNSDSSLNKETPFNLDPSDFGPSNLGPSNSNTLKKALLTCFLSLFLSCTLIILRYKC